IDLTVPLETEPFEVPDARLGGGERLLRALLLEQDARAERDNLPCEARERSARFASDAGLSLSTSEIASPIPDLGERTVGEPGVGHVLPRDDVAGETFGLVEAEGRRCLDEQARQIHLGTGQRDGLAEAFGQGEGLPQLRLRAHEVPET